MDDEHTSLTRWRHTFDRAERSMQDRMSAVRARFPCQYSGGNIRMLLREGGNCMDEFLDGPWQNNPGREAQHAIDGLLRFAKSIEANVLAYVAAHSRNDPADRVWLATCESAAIFRERAELAIADVGRDTTSPRAANRRGRRPGAGGYAKADEPLLTAMRAIIEEDPTIEPWSAAGQMVPRAKGSGEFEAKQKRLHGRYLAKFGV